MKVSPYQPPRNLDENAKWQEIIHAQRSQAINMYAGRKAVRNILPNLIAGSAIQGCVQLAQGNDYKDPLQNAAYALYAEAAFSFVLAIGLAFYAPDKEKLRKLGYELSDMKEIYNKEDKRPKPFYSKTLNYAATICFFGAINAMRSTNTTQQSIFSAVSVISLGLVVSLVIKDINRIKRDYPLGIDMQIDENAIQR